MLHHNTAGLQRVMVTFPILAPVIGHHATSFKFGKCNTIYKKISTEDIYKQTDWWTSCIWQECWESVTIASEDVFIMFFHKVKSKKVNTLLLTRGTTATVAELVQKSAMPPVFLAVNCFARNFRQQRCLKVKRLWLFIWLQTFKLGFPIIWFVFIQASCQLHFFCSRHPCG